MILMIKMTTIENPSILGTLVMSSPLQGLLVILALIVLIIQKVIDMSYRVIVIWVGELILVPALYTITPVPDRVTAVPDRVTSIRLNSVEKV